MGLEHIALEEMPDQNEARFDIALANRSGVIEQEGRQLEELAAIGQPRIPRYGPA